MEYSRNTGPQSFLCLIGLLLGTEERAPETEICTIQKGKLLFEN